MHIDNLDRAIYERFIVPTQRQRTDKAGIEFELPIVNREPAPVDFDAVHQVAEAFTAHFGFTQTARDADGFIYSASDPETADNLSFDCSYNTVELSFGTASDLHELNRRFAAYYRYLYDGLDRFGHTLTGMGVNPRYAVNRNVPVASERYRMLLHHLSSYPKYEKASLFPFHHHPNFGLFSCASQVQLDVEDKHLPEVLNTFNRLEPLKALLFANSIWMEDGQTLLCSRDYFWRNSLHGFNPHNVDMFAANFDSVDDIVAYIRSMSLYCVERDGQYINFAPTPLADYFASDRIKGEVFDGTGYKPIVFQPEAADLKDLRSFKFEDLTFRGTVEFRSVCEQPVGEIFAASALHVGLMEKLPELTALLAQDRTIYHKGYTAAELRQLFVQKDFPGNIFDRKAVSALILKILDLAKAGLAQRGMDEEDFLAPLYPRAERLESPAVELLNGLARGATIEDYIDKFGRLN